MAERRTKIVCTIGPAVGSLQALRGLVKAGMNVARLNCSHGDWETKLKWIEWLRRVSPPVGPLGILVDLQGPKFRLGDIPEGHRSVLSSRTVTLGNDPEAEIPIQQAEVLAELGPGTRLLLGDGQVELRIRSGSEGRYLARVLSGGPVKSRQGVTVLNRSFDVPALTQKDLHDIEMAAKAGADFIALSYVRSAVDMTRLRAEVDRWNPDIQLVAKLETPEAVRHLEAITRASDTVMVARGDLGLQIPLEDVPMVQKQAIRLAALCNKPVITATQMLESMMHSPRPTRAEAADVANAVLDGTDAVMLSGETAAGDYPLESVRWMSRIAKRTERRIDHEQRLLEFSRGRRNAPHPEAVAFAVSHLAAMLDPKAILTSTTSGQTPRLVSRFRPEVPIWCGAWQTPVLRQLSLSWGVQAVQVPKEIDTDRLVDVLIQAFQRPGMLSKGDLTVVTAGVPAGVPGRTNMVLTRRVE